MMYKVQELLIEQYLCETYEYTSWCYITYLYFVAHVIKAEESAQGFH